MKRELAVRQALATVLALYALLFVVGRCTGCALFERAPAAVTVAEYTHALGECRDEGKDAGSYAVYEACAREADLRFGLKGAAR